jgi:putative DNA primase/helicase
LAEFGRIDFADLAARLLDRADVLVPQWLPGGKREGHEWAAAKTKNGGPGDSLKVNLKTGAWAHFIPGGGSGGDLISCYAYLHNMSNVEAARELAEQSGMADAQAPARQAAPPAIAKPPRSDEGWKTQRPVPAHAPAPTFKHMHRKPEDIEHVAEYRTGADLHGYVVRFRTSDGGKDPLPYTWCISARDGAARWHWKQPDEPRPLYFPGHELPAGRTVVLVEGEKKGDALQALLDVGAPGVYCVASWSGGCKAWKKADWSWLAGAHVIGWPDCDSQREALTPTERKDTPDDLARAVLQAAKPLLPEEKQPGMQAMLGIGAVLRDGHGCVVQMLPIPRPGEVADGWDCGDAIGADGWGFDRVLGFFGQAYALPAWAGAEKTEPPSPVVPDAAAKPARDGLADAGSDDDAFQHHIDFVCAQLKCMPWDLGVNRKLLIAALTKAPLLQDCLGFNDLTNAPGTVVAWPWRDAPGMLEESDDLRLGDWLSREYKLKAASRAALSEAIATVADMRRFHPVRDWLRAQQWDQKPRLDRWLMHVLSMEADQVRPRRRRYLALVGRFLLMGLVARVMEPGVKFDYSPVFEGLPGVGKSTLVAELVGKEYFSDTHFDIGNGKDGMEQLEGLWGYELSELTAFKRADSEQIKQFFSSTVDRFRGAYGKFVQPHKRQCVIFCTTNKRQYLYDLTGNRRFWPVWIEKRIRLAWLRRWRAQLFAEAYARWQAGEQFAPSPDEEAAYFLPEQ